MAELAFSKDGEWLAMLIRWIHSHSIFMTASPLLQLPNFWGLISWTTVTPGHLCDASQAHGFPLLHLWHGPVTSWRQNCTWLGIPLCLPPALCWFELSGVWFRITCLLFLQCSCAHGSGGQALCIVVTQRKGKVRQRWKDIMKKSCCGTCTSKGDAWIGRRGLWSHFKDTPSK